MLCASNIEVTSMADSSRREMTYNLSSKYHRRADIRRVHVRHVQCACCLVSINVCFVQVVKYKKGRIILFYV